MQKTLNDKQFGSLVYEYAHDKVFCEIMKDQHEGKPFTDLALEYLNYKEFIKQIRDNMTDPDFMILMRGYLKDSSTLLPLLNASALSPLNSSTILQLSNTTPQPDSTTVPGNKYPPTPIGRIHVKRHYENRIT